jgi:excisionase family DNA binding protein
MKDGDGLPRPPEAAEEVVTSSAYQHDLERTRHENADAADGHHGIGCHFEALFTAQEVAQMLRVSLSMVYKLRRSGALASVQIGSLYRFNPEAVRAFMKGERRRF